MRKARPADWLSIYGEPGSAPDVDSDAARLERKRRGHVQLHDLLIRTIGAEAVVDLYEANGLPDLDTPPPLLTAEQQEARALAARQWADQARAEAMDAWRQTFGGDPPPPAEGGPGRPEA